MSLPSLLFFFHSIPLYSTPFHSVPYYPTPPHSILLSTLHSTTLYSTPLHSTPLHSTPPNASFHSTPPHHTIPHHTASLYSIPIYSTPLHFDTALFFSCILLLRMQPPSPSHHSLLRLFLLRFAISLCLSLSVLFFAFFRPPLSYSPFFLPPPPPAHTSSCTFFFRQLLSPLLHVSFILLSLRFRLYFSLFFF